MGKQKIFILAVKKGVNFICLIPFEADLSKRQETLDDTHQ